MLYISDSVTQFLRRELLASGEVSEFSSCPAHSAQSPLPNILRDEPYCRQL